MAFAVPAPDLDAWEAWLGQHGVAIEERRTWERGGRSLYFRDPDQHLIELATPGTWSIY
jgi:catechol 2,3-dioxygenase-like lactoylglutathione lyase family enzyme